MSQHDYDLANAAGSAFRSDANAALAAIVSQNSGATAPATTFAYQWWADTTTGILKQRNAANSAWISVLTLSTGFPVGAAASGANADITSLTALTSINGGQLAGFRNALINGSFHINQRAPASNADDTYAHDRWYALTQTGTIALSTLTDVENTTPRMARLTQSQASAQRMGYAQIIEGVNCKHLRGQEVTFRFGRTRISTTANVRYAVLEWTGTEDAVTSDVVNDWTSATYTAGNFFNSTTLTVSAVVQHALTANTLTDGSAVTVTLGSAFNNLIVLAWTEATAAQNVTLDLGKAQIEIGGTATTFEGRGYGAELVLCQRYVEKSFAPGTTPAQNVGVGTGESRAMGRVSGASALAAFIPVRFLVPKRAAPTAITLYNPSAANAQIRDSAFAVDCSASTTANANAVGFDVTGTGNAASTAVTSIMNIHWLAEAEL